MGVLGPSAFGTDFTDPRAAADQLCVPPALPEMASPSGPRSGRECSGLARSQRIVDGVLCCGRAGRGCWLWNAVAADGNQRRDGLAVSSSTKIRSPPALDAAELHAALLGGRVESGRRCRDGPRIWPGVVRSRHPMGVLAGSAGAHGMVFRTFSKARVKTCRPSPRQMWSVTPGGFPQAGSC